MNDHHAFTFSIKQSKKRIPSSHSYSPERTLLQYIYRNFSISLMTLCLACHKNVIMWNIYVCVTLPSKHIYIRIFYLQIHTFHICSIKIIEKDYRSKSAICIPMQGIWKVPKNWADDFEIMFYQFWEKVRHIRENRNSITLTDFLSTLHSSSMSNWEMYVHFNFNIIYFVQCLFNILSHQTVQNDVHNSCICTSLT